MFQETDRVNEVYLQVDTIIGYRRASLLTDRSWTMDGSFDDKGLYQGAKLHEWQDDAVSWCGTCGCRELTRFRAGVADTVKNPNGSWRWSSLSPTLPEMLTRIASTLPRPYAVKRAQSPGCRGHHQHTPRLVIDAASKPSTGKPRWSTFETLRTAPPSLTFPRNPHIRLTSENESSIL